MLAPALPEDEVLRIAALLGCKILDTSPEARFDRLTKLASTYFDVPIALVSLVDSERQWFKSHQGLDATETPRNISFCGHAILQDEIFCVEDTFDDPRFADNPLVTAAPLIRFYAGAPLKNAEGYRLGTLCIIDTEPRQLSQEQRDALRTFADCVEDEVNRTKTHEEEKQNLSKTTDLLRSVLDSAYEYSIIATDADGLISTFNRGAELMLGYQAEETIGKFNLTQLHLGHKIDALAAQFNAGRKNPTPGFSALTESARRQGSDKREWIYVHKSGQQIPVSLVITTTRNAKGKITGYLAIADDISDTKSLKSQQRLQLGALNAAANAILITDADGRIRWTNPAWSQLTGFSADEVIGKNPNIVKSDQQDDSFYQDLWKTILAGKTWQGEIINRRKNGSHYFEYQTITPLLDENGQIEAFIAIKEDITQQKKAEAALRDQVAQTQAIVDNIIDGIITIDKRGIIQSFNPAAETLFGYSGEEAKGNNVKILMPSPYQEEHDQYLHNYLATGIARIIGIGREVVGRRKDGSLFPMDLSVSQISREGEIVFVGLVRDITERKRIEKMKTEFVSTVSHELRTPLTSISGSLGLITGGAFGEMPSQAIKMLEIAHKNSLRLTYLINDLLDMEKLVAGKMRFDMQIHPLNSLVEMALESNQTFGVEHGVTIELTSEIPEDKVRVDQERLMQVFSNLFSNAIKYSPANGKVELSVEDKPFSLIIKIKDHGPGIPNEFRHRIFQKFSQADASDTRIQSGTGLGLAITRELVERMGGQIDFESVEGQGASFFFELPKQVAFERGHRNERDNASNKKRILVVEDEPDIAKLLAMVLTRAGYEVDIAYNGKQALEALDRRHYSAMTLDLMLPDISGIEIIAKTRSRDSGEELPIIVISAKMEQGKLELTTNDENIDWLAKPIDEGNLIQTLADKLKAIKANNDQTIRVLHVEDDVDLHQVIAAMVGESVTFDLAVNLAEARQQLVTNQYDTVLLDLSLPDGSGLELLPQIRKSQSNARIAILSAKDPSQTEVQAVETTLVKSQISPTELLNAIQREVE